MSDIIERLRGRASLDEYANSHNRGAIMTDEILSPARIRARELHEQLLRDDPKYRKEWEAVCAIWRTVLADIDLRDDPDKERS